MKTTTLSLDAKSNYLQEKKESCWNGFMLILLSFLLSWRKKFLEHFRCEYCS